MRVAGTTEVTLFVPFIQGKTSDLAGRSSDDPRVEAITTGRALVSCPAFPKHSFSVNYC